MLGKMFLYFFSTSIYQLDVLFLLKLHEVVVQIAFCTKHSGVICLHLYSIFQYKLCINNNIVILPWI